MPGFQVLPMLPSRLRRGITTIPYLLHLKFADMNGTTMIENMK